jgi:hypothetical protein
MSYDRYVIVRGLFSHDECTKIKDCAETSKDIKKHAFGKPDGLGRISKMCIWNHAGNDVLGTMARTRKVAGTMQDLLGGDEIYHYHSKVTHVLCCSLI